MRTSRRTGSIGATRPAEASSAVHRILEHRGGQADLADDDLGVADAVHAHGRPPYRSRRRWQTRPVAPPAIVARPRPGRVAAASGRRADAAVVPPVRPRGGAQGRRHAGHRRRSRRRALPARAARGGVPGRRRARRGGGPHRRAPPGAAGSSTRSTAPRPSPAGCRSTRTCSRSRTSTGSRSGVINLPALGETVWAGRGLGCFSERGPGAGERPRRRSTAPTSCRARSAHWPAGHRRALRRRRRGAAHLGRRLRLRAGRHRPGRGHGRPDRGALRHRPDAGDPRRGRRAGSPTSPAREGIEGGSGVGTNGHVHDALLDAPTTPESAASLVDERRRAGRRGRGRPGDGSCRSAPRTPSPPPRRRARPPG